MTNPSIASDLIERLPVDESALKVLRSVVEGEVKRDSEAMSTIRIAGDAR